ncbi:MAG: LysM peptidoglycan-binding domain-containing protein [Roseinatronobacter sp.]
MLKTMPKETLMQWAVGTIAVAGAASVAYVLIVPRGEPALPVPDVSALVDPAILTAPTADAPPETRIAAAIPADELAPRFDIVRVTDIGNVLIAGQAPASAAVAALLDETPVAQSVSSTAGEFVMMFDVTPNPAPRVLELEVRLPDGGRVRSRDTILLSPASDTLPGQRAPDGTNLPSGTAREVAVAPLFPGATSSAPRPAKLGEASVALSTTTEQAPDVTASETETTTPLIAGATLTAPRPQATPEPDTSAPVAVLVRSDGSVQALGRTGRLPQPGNVVIDTVGYDADGAVALGGRSTVAAEEIQIYLDNQPILRTRPAEDGTWQAQLDGIERGTYRLRVDEIDVAARVTSRAEIPFQRVTPEIAREASGPQALIVQPGNTLWAMSRDQFGEGARFMRIFDANRDQIRDPNLIFPGQVFVLPRE